MFMNSSFRRPVQKRSLREIDYAILKHKLCDSPSIISIDAEAAEACIEKNIRFLLAVSEGGAEEKEKTPRSM